MNLYILRHAIAVARGTKEYPNDDRPLTKEGIDKMKREADCFPSIIKQIDVIYTSPLSRARETAAIAAKSLHAEKKITVTDALLAETGEEEIFALLNKEKNPEHVMIVGHEPHLSFVASSLLGVDESAIEFKKGALCLIEISGAVRKGAGTLKWLLQPKQLRMMGKI
ncbi:MAG: phosphohistidine phosphatase SixA [Ignavibacteriales bacterium]|nr:phosphohistidine phosphatase SixA [Ignavibacteriales bacterium]